MPLAGGPAATLATSLVSAADWATEGSIYFAAGSRGEEGIQKVADSGGEPQAVTKPERSKNEMEHNFPEVLPGGKAVVFAERSATQPSWDDADIFALNLATGEKRVLAKGGTDPHYVESGYLVFLRAGVLLAVAFDPSKLAVRGAPVPVAENILENPRIGAGQYAVSKNGLMVFIPGGVTYGEHELVFVDKAGNARSLTAKRRPYEDFTLSPDGKLVATTVEGPVTDTWVHDIARDTETRFTFGVENRDPTWTPDGRHLAYSGFRDGKYRMFWKPLDGSAPEETLLAIDKSADAWFFTPNGNELLFAVGTGISDNNIGLLPLNDRSNPKMLFPPQLNVEWAVLSPDGKWIAFNGDESGRSEV